MKKKTTALCLVWSLFSIPQLITALAGGGIALMVHPVLVRWIDREGAL